MTTHGGPGLGARFRRHFARRALQEAGQRWSQASVIHGGREKVRRAPGKLREIVGQDNGPSGGGAA